MNGLVPRSAGCCVGERKSRNRSPQTGFPGSLPLRASRPCSGYGFVDSSGCGRCSRSRRRTIALWCATGGVSARSSRALWTMPTSARHAISCQCLGNRSADIAPCDRRHGSRPNPNNHLEPNQAQRTLSFSGQRSLSHCRCGSHRPLRHHRHWAIRENSDQSSVGCHGALLSVRNEP